MDEPVSAVSYSPFPGPPPAPPEAAGEPFIFHGEAREYFRIWIVNVFLTIITGGIYAAWAKVRRRRYLRGNTELLGHRFDYTAQPKRLLIGNLIIVTLFLAYALFGAVYPVIRVAAVLVALCLLPWIIVRSLAFNAHNTVHRGIRFRFHPSLSAATSTYFLQFLLVPLTLGFYYPVWARAKRQFQVERHRYGSGYFRFEVKAGPFYAAYLPAGLAVLAALIVVGLGVALLRNQIRITNLTVALTFGIYLPTFYLARQFVHARIFNAVWNGTQLDECRFKASMSASRWLRLQVGNWSAILGTGGFLYPWAVMRAAHYTASCLRFFPTPEFYRLQKVRGIDGGALSDTAAEFVGLDFGL